LDAISEATRLHELGNQQNQAGHPLQARRTLERSLRVAEGAPANQDRSLLQARIWISLATSESELAGLASGLVTLSRAESYALQAASPALDVVLQNQLGYMKVRGGHVEDGLRHLDTAVSLLRHAEVSTQLAILVNRGTTHLFRRNLGAARNDFNQTAELAADNGEATFELMARHNLGYLEFLAGNLARALQIMDDVLALGVDISRGVILLDRSRVLLEAGLHREADEALREAGELFRADRLWKDVGEVELARAECALLDGEIGAARRLAASARTRFRRRGNDRWRREAELVLLQGDLEAGRPGSRLAAPALRLGDEFQAEGLPTRARTARLLGAEALLRTAHLDEANAAARQAGPIRANDPVSARLHTRLVRAKLQLANGDSRRSRREVQTGLRELARHRARFGSIDMQTASAAHGRQLAELDLSLALAAGKPAGVLASIEQSRAVSARLQAVVAPEDPDAAELLSELRQIAEELRVLESDPAAGKRASVQRRRATELQQLLRSRSWQTEGSGYADEPATLDQTRVALDRDGSTCVCYFEVGGTLHALLLTPSRSQIIPLGDATAAGELIKRVRADLDVLANGHLPAGLLAAITRSLTRSTESLQLLLIEPLPLPGARLVITPTGALATLPWGLMPALRGRPIVVAPSATSWVNATAVAVPISPAQVSVFAGPDLAFAVSEGSEIAGIWARSSTFSGASADRAGFQQAMGSSDIVHVAAHGQHQPENPLFSSIRLADGPVYAYELDQTRRAAEHVVLSACELGQATIRPGDEALGLTSVLLRLGSRSVISGVTRVNDRVAATVMVRYHRALAGGLDSASALAEACMLQDGPPAPFVCFGSSWAPCLPAAS
jgi:hypothetical protein